MGTRRCPRIRGSIRSSVLLAFGTSPITAMCRRAPSLAVHLAACFIPQVSRWTPRMASFLSPTASATGYSLFSPPTSSDKEQEHADTPARRRNTDKNACATTQIQQLIDTVAQAFVPVDMTIRCPVERVKMLPYIL